jgi:hypothetical protein
MEQVKWEKKEVRNRPYTEAHSSPQVGWEMQIQWDTMGYQEFWSPFRSLPHASFLAFGFDFSLLFSSRDLFFPFLVMKIKVNDSHYVEVDPSDTIWSLKCAIYSKRIRGHNGKLLPPPDDQRLVDRATQAVLSDCGKTLEFYGIHEGSSIGCKLSRCSEEYGFRRLLDVSRKKERTSLKVGVHDGLTMSFCTCIKHLCWHAHELGMMVYLSESHLLTFDA